MSQIIYGFVGNDMYLGAQQRDALLAAHPDKVDKPGDPSLRGLSDEHPYTDHPYQSRWDWPGKVYLGEFRGYGQSYGRAYTSPEYWERAVAALSGPQPTSFSKIEFHPGPAMRAASKGVPK